MEIGDARAHLAFDHPPDFACELGVGFRVKQNHSRIPHETIGPGCDHARADQSHDRIEPAQAPNQTAGERQDREHRCCRIGQHVDISRAHVVIGAAATVCMVVIVVVAMRVVVRSAQDEGAGNIYGKSQSGDQ